MIKPTEAFHWGGQNSFGPPPAPSCPFRPKEKSWTGACGSLFHTSALTHIQLFKLSSCSAHTLDLTTPFHMCCEEVVRAGKRGSNHDHGRPDLAVVCSISRHVRAQKQPKKYSYCAFCMFRELFCAFFSETPHRSVKRMRCTSGSQSCSVWMTGKDYRPTRDAGGCVFLVGGGSWTRDMFCP